MGQHATAEELGCLLAELAFLQKQLAQLPETAKLTRIGIMGRIKVVEARIARQRAANTPHGQT